MVLFAPNLAEWGWDVPLWVEFAPPIKRISGMRCEEKLHEQVEEIGVSSE